MSDVAILFDSPWAVGGTITYTAHLALATGLPVYKPGSSWRKGKPLLGTVPVTIAPFESIAKDHELLIVPVPNDSLPDSIYKKAVCVLHDADELGKFKRHWSRVERFYTPRVSTYQLARNMSLSLTPQAIIPHPYKLFLGDMPRRMHNAISHCQFNGPKGGMIMLEANARLPRAKRIQIVGAPHRTWVHFAVKKRFPDYVPHKPFKSDCLEAGVLIAARGAYNVDLTVFKTGDGGGVSYTMMEAIDAGAIPIVSRQWVDAPGDAHLLCLSVDGIDELCDVLRGDIKEYASLRIANRKHIRAFHSYEIVKRQFNDLLRRFG